MGKLAGRAPIAAIAILGLAGTAGAQTPTAPQEYRPGSALFVVWQQDRSGRHPYGDLQWSRDPGGLFGEPGRNVFTVKATYWMGS